MRARSWLAATILLLAACATEPQRLKAYPGVREQIIGYYNDQSVTDNPVCATARMQTIGYMQVLSDTPTQLVTSVQYFYDTENFDKFHGGCQGQGTRTFTLDKAGGAPTVAGMSRLQGGLQAGRAGSPG